MSSLLSCVETFKEIEIFVEQCMSCINCKGVEKEIFWLILMGFRIFRILNELLYLVHLWGGPLFFGSWGMKIFPRQTFFSVSWTVKTFFCGVIFLQTIFFMPPKNLVGLFLLLQTIYSAFPKTTQIPQNAIVDSTT